MVFVPPPSHSHGELEIFAKKVAIAAAFAIGLALLWRIRSVLILVFIAAVLATAIAPAVQRVRIAFRFYLRRHITRGTAVAIVYFPFLLLVLALALFVFPRFVEEGSRLRAQLPSLIETNILAPLERWVPMGTVRAYLHNGIHVPAQRVVGAVRVTATVVASFVAVLFMVAYMLVDAERLRNLILLLFSPETRARRHRVLNRIARRMTSWLAGQMILSGIIGVSMFIALLLLRLPYALPLAIIAMIGEMVPVIGPIVGTMPALAIAALQAPWQFWSVLILAIVLQKLENFFIAPRVMARQVALSPLAVFIAFMAGASLLGIVGALLAVPIAAIVQVAFGEIFIARRERRQDRDRSGTLLRRRE
jgi:predicted PurR-regulated permease PerM